MGTNKAAHGSVFGRLCEYLAAILVVAMFLFYWCGNCIVFLIFTLVYIIIILIAWCLCASCTFLKVSFRYLILFLSFDRGKR